MSAGDEHVSEHRSSVRDQFQRAHSAHRASPVLVRIWRNAYGEDYPEDVNPTAFYSRSILLRLRAGLRIDPGGTVVDLGCGNGGAGLWFARELGAKLIGIDLSAIGVANASKRAAELGLSDRVHFQEGDITATGLSPGSCDGAISLDVLALVPDKTAAISEVARILRPGARFAFTTWEQEGYSTRLNAAQLADHRPALVAAGFDVELYEQPMDWRRQQQAAAEGLLASEQELAAELEPPAVEQFMRLARGMLADMPRRRYVFVIAQLR
jgi:SAM-dependent methyltransferase